MTAFYNKKISKTKKKKLFEKPVKISEEKLKIDSQSTTSERCIDVNDVFFSGAEILNKYQKKKLAKLVVGKCIDALGISNFLKEITNHYIGRGYSNARAYLEKYDANTKILYLVIAEGKISSIMLNNINPNKSEAKPSILDKSQMFFAFPSSKGDVFNIHDFEQGIFNLNRLRSNNATIESRPSEISGESDIVINNYKNNEGGLLHGWQTAVNYENTGSKSTGVYNTTYSINKDNLLSINDNVSFSKIKSDRSETDMISFSAPFGYWNFRYNKSSNEYNSITSSRVKIEGTSTNHDINLDRLLFRGKTNEISLNSNLNFRNQTRKVAGVTDISSQKLSTATKLQTARTIAISGAVTGTATGFDGSANIVIATTAIDGSKISTGTIPAARIPTLNQSTTGNAATATKLQTARTIAISGAVTGTATGFDGSANIAIATTAIDGSKISTGTIPAARIPAASTSAAGAVKLNNTLTSTSTTEALTAAQGKALNDRFINDFLNLKTENGYQKLPNGLIIQWGQQNELTTGTFPISFPTIALSICATLKAEGAPWDGSVTSSYIVSNSQFKVGCGQLNGNILYWIAIGY